MAVPGFTERRCCADTDLVNGCGLGNQEKHDACRCKTCGALWVHLRSKPSVAKEGEPLTPLTEVTIVRTAW